MKILLTWYANPPDPYYWIWVRDIDGIVVKLSSMTRRQLDYATLRGLKRVLGLNSMLIVDSLLEPLGGRYIERQQSWILYSQSLLGADVLVHRDYPAAFSMDVGAREKLLKKTLLNAELAVKIADKLGVDIMLVVQGWDLSSYSRCARHYAEIGARYVGIGSLVPKRSDKRFLMEVTSVVREILGSKVHMHVFGVMSPRTVVRLSRYVDSADVSTPIKAAIAREVFIETNGRLRRVHVSLLGERSLFELISKVPGLAHVFENSSTARDVIRCLAVYNAYTIVDWIRRVVGR